MDLRALSDCKTALSDQRKHVFKCSSRSEPSSLAVSTGVQSGVRRNLRASGHAFPQYLGAG